MNNEHYIELSSKLSAFYENRIDKNNILTYITELIESEVSAVKYDLYPIGKDGAKNLKNELKNLFEDRYNGEGFSTKDRTDIINMTIKDAIKKYNIKVKSLNMITNKDVRDILDYAWYYL